MSDLLFGELGVTREEAIARLRTYAEAQLNKEDRVEKLIDRAEDVLDDVEELTQTNPTVLSSIKHIANSELEEHGAIVYALITTAGELSRLRRRVAELEEKCANLS